jgi:Na+-driven multidrug efflux pump
MMGEWWATESIVFLAGFLPDPTPKIGAMAIYQTMNALAYMVDFGAHVAANVRIGNELGRGRAVEAKRSSRVAPIYAGVISAIMGICLFLLRDYYPRIFTGTYGCCVFEWGDEEGLRHSHVSSRLR